MFFYIRSGLPEGAVSAVEHSAFALKLKVDMLGLPLGPDVKCAKRTQ